VILGLVSNCWRRQLAEGAALETLIAEASRRGYRAIELRQTCLGRYETAGDYLPLADALAELPGQFPEIRFNVAVCVPFMNPEPASDDPVRRAGKWAAQAVSGEFPPHLRLVDLMTTGRQLQDAAPAAIGNTIARLVRSLVEIGGFLSVENSLQPWQPFREAWNCARRQLGSDAARLRLCFDPCNLLLPDDGTDPAGVTASLSADELSMVHFKQRRDGRFLPTVSDGDVDWRAQLAILKQHRYTGPGLFEIEPHKNIWDHLDESRDYLARLARISHHGVTESTED